MDQFLQIASLYLLGGIIGFVGEVFFRRFVSIKKWIKPGFLYGPFIPLYGFGFALFYLFCEFLHFDTGYQWLDQTLLILLLGVLLTFIEYIAGLIFVKGMRIKLWDYSKQWGNFQGLICPLFSFFWLLASAIYVTLLHPLFMQYAVWFASGGAVSALFIGIFIGIHLIDFCMSVNLASKIKKAITSKDFIAHWEKMKVAFAEKGKELKKKVSFLFPFNNPRRIGVKEAIAAYKEKALAEHKAFLEKKAAKKRAKEERKHGRDAD